ncbi:uncharacterized protein G2W53_030598 [Senna tora]|uniref:Uncharacterized protein n=1 Tax=Senna tora TaxID=362788 RepID=A0A834TFU0_9FABA|nr:uncharacterized protein G2W53_030598 [Senna tora]
METGDENCVFPLGALRGNRVGLHEMADEKNSLFA